MKYAIVKHSGGQKKMRVGANIMVDRMSQNVGDEVVLGDVLMIHDEDTITFGQPLVADAQVVAKVIAHARGEKIRVRHFKRRKHHMKRQGHRQDFTQLEIVEIAVAGKAAKKPVSKKADSATSVGTESKDVKKAPAKKATASKKTDATAKRKVVKKDQGSEKE